MGVLETIKGVFGRKDEELTTVSLCQQINSSMELLLQKSGNLNDSFEEEKAEIAKLKEEVEKLGPSKEILAAKLEQDILGRLTTVSFACDKALMGKDDGEVKKSLYHLKTGIQQRLQLQ